MNSNIRIFLLHNSHKFPIYSISSIKKLLETASHEKQVSLLHVTFKSPAIMFAISFFFGSLGIDRFLLGDVGLGILKFITFGGFGIWTFIDWFLIMENTRRYNLKRFQHYINLDFPL